MLKLLKPWNVCNCVCMCVYIYIIFIYYLFKSFIRSSIKTRSHVWTHLSRVTHREWISPACLINVALVPSFFGHFSPFTLCVYLVKCLCAVYERLQMFILVLMSTFEFYALPLINQVLESPLNSILGSSLPTISIVALDWHQVIIGRPSVFLSQPFSILMTV